MSIYSAFILNTKFIRNISIFFVSKAVYTMSYATTQDDYSN